MSVSIVREKSCSIPDCARPWHCKEWCKMHYQRWSRHGDPMIAKYRLAPRGWSDAERFWFFVDKTSGHGPYGDCWLYFAATDRGGYGIFSLNGKSVKAHRYSYFLTYGTWPEPAGLHSCDTPGCVNPRHIQAGTALENTADMISRGRIRPSKGSRNGAAKLTERDVLAIRTKINRGMPVKEIAKVFKVSDGAIYKIQRNKAWAHITEAETTS